MVLDRQAAEVRELTERQKLSRERTRLRNRRYYFRHIVKCREARKQYQKKHRPDVARRTREWKKRNPDVVREHRGRRRAMKLRALHPDHNPFKERALYRLAAFKTELLGTEHHIDHTIPLARGGWHHHENLTVLPAHINLQKHDDPFWTHPDYPSWRNVPRFLWPKDLEPVYTKILLDESK